MDSGLFYGILKQNSNGIEIPTNGFYFLNIAGILHRQSKTLNQNTVWILSGSEVLDLNGEQSNHVSTTRTEFLF